MQQHRPNSWHAHPTAKPCLLLISLTTAATSADEVYVEMKRKAKDAILELIEKEREGEQIERLLLKNVLDIFMVVGPACHVWQAAACPATSVTASLCFSCQWNNKLLGAGLVFMDP